MMKEAVDELGNLKMGTGGKPATSQQLKAFGRSLKTFMEQGLKGNSLLKNPIGKEGLKSFVKNADFLWKAGVSNAGEGTLTA